MAKGGRIEISDPIEKIVADALVSNGEDFFYEKELTANEGEALLDFYLPKRRAWIECKQFYTDRSDRQLSSHTDVILIQGRAAANAFADMIGKERNKNQLPER